MSELPLYDPPKVGGDILAYCSKCQGEFSHVVVSMVDRKPARVQCKMCKGNHNFKRMGDTRAKSVSRSSTPSSAPRKQTVLAQDYWQQQMDLQKGKAMKPYSPKQAFQKSDVINHSSFGIGIVEEVRIDKKIVVIFRNGEKILVHGLG
jgi:hypothetical protein